MKYPNFPAFNFILDFWQSKIFFVALHIKPKIIEMNKMNFHDFYEYLWEDEALEIIISTAYLEKNDDFIRNYTLELFRFYEMSNVKPAFIKKQVEITFTNLFFFNPGTENIREIPDNFRNSLE